MSSALRAGLISLAGCADEPIDGWMEGRYLRIGRMDPEVPPLCGGDLQYFDGYAERVAGFLDADAPRAPIDMRVYWSSEGVFEHCGESPFGCFDGRSGIHTTYQSATHEIVHAIAADLRRVPTSFAAEGLAVALEENVVTFPRSAPVDSFDIREFEAGLDYHAAGHFVRWLLETEGPEKLREWYRAGPTASRRRFEKAYGRSVEEAQEIYFDEAPRIYPRRWACVDPPIVQSTDGSWQVNERIACEQDARNLGGWGTHLRRTIEVAVSGAYNVYVDEGAWFGLYGCLTHPDDEVPTERLVRGMDVPLDVVRHETWESIRRGLPPYYSGGVIHQLWMEAGSYDLWLGLDEGDFGEVSLWIWPALAYRNPNPPIPPVPPWP